MKKLFLSMLVMVCAFATASAYDFMVGDLAYYVNEDNASVSVTYEQEPKYLGWSGEQNAELYTPAYANLSGALTIPASVQYNGKTYPVTRIGKESFQACLSLTSVNIPATVTAIEPYAFRYCDALVAMTVDPENPTYDSRDNCNAIVTKQAITVDVPYTDVINGQTQSYTIPQAYLKDQVAFACKGTIVPSSATSIGDYAFIGCRTLNSVVIPEGVTEIGHNAFVGCGIESLTLPATLTKIQKLAFESCMKLKDVYAYFDPDNVTLENNIWQMSLITLDHTTNLHVYPQYVQWYLDQPDSSPWVWQGNRFNVVGDLGQKLYMHGSYNNWNDVEFEKNAEGKWELKDIEMPAGAEFKLVDQNNTWYGATDDQYQITEEALGTSLSLVDGRNFMMAVAGTWTFTVDMDSKTLVVTGEADQPEPEHVYILGEVNDKTWAANDGVEMTLNDNGLYTADVVFDGRGQSGENYFSFTTLLAEDDDDGGWAYIEPFRFGAVSENDYWFSDEQLGSEISLTFDDYQAIRIMGGDYTLTLNLEDMTLVITRSTYLKGDVDGNGKVDVTDVNIVVNIILGKDSADNYDGRADVNGVDGVDVSDVNAIVNIILGKDTK